MYLCWNTAYQTSLCAKVMFLGSVKNIFRYLLHSCSSYTDFDLSLLMVLTMSSLFSNMAPGLLCSFLLSSSATTADYSLLAHCLAALLVFSRAVSISSGIFILHLFPSTFASFVLPLNSSLLFSFRDSRKYEGFLLCSCICDAYNFLFLKKVYCSIVYLAVKLNHMTGSLIIMDFHLKGNLTFLYCPQNILCKPTNRSMCVFAFIHSLIHNVALSFYFLTHLERLVCQMKFPCNYGWNTIIFYFKWDQPHFWNPIKACCPVSFPALWRTVLVLITVLLR